MIAVKINGNPVFLNKCAEIDYHLGKFNYYNHGKGLRLLQSFDGPKINFTWLEICKPRKIEPSPSGGSDNTATMKIVRNNGDHGQREVSVMAPFGTLMSFYVFLQRFQRKDSHGYCNHCKKRPDSQNRNNCVGNCFFQVIEREFNGRATVR